MITLSRRFRHVVYALPVCMLLWIFISLLALESAHKPIETKWFPLMYMNINRSGMYDSVNDNFIHSFNKDSASCRFTAIADRDKKPVDLRLIVITYARPKSLVRLIKSLDRALYGQSNVMLEVWIDRSKTHDVHAETLYALQNVSFHQGRCNVIVHPFHVGIRGQWLSTWNPEPDSSEIAVILEDDLTVSPHFYTYLKMAHSKYQHRRDIYGFTLQGASVRHSDGSCCLNVPQENKVFLYPTLGTSGFSPKRDHWIKFQEWLKYVLVGDVHIPLIDDHVSSLWYKELSKTGKEDSMWEMEYLFYATSMKQYTLYPNFDQLGFAFNWFEDGLHSKGESITDVNEERKKIVLRFNVTINDLPDSPVIVDNNGDIVLVEGAL
ncbi:hypothetical protein ACF0H5_011298 [Mactra antiquata]